MNSTLVIKMLLEQELGNQNNITNQPTDLPQVEDLIKNYIDKLIDVKNKKLTMISNTEISKIIDNSN